MGCLHRVPEYVLWYCLIVVFCISAQVDAATPKTPKVDSILGALLILDYLLSKISEDVPHSLLEFLLYYTPICAVWADVRLGSSDRPILILTETCHFQKLLFT